jgi:predicted GIY-YIG superfamily endonuclease
VPRGCRCNRDTYLYELRDKGKTVYRGITTDVERRVREHKRDGKRFTTVWSSAAPSCRKNAVKYEKDGVHTYKRGHGTRPRYNKVL